MVVEPPKEHLDRSDLAYTGEKVMNINMSRDAIPG